MRINIFTHLYYLYHFAAIFFFFLPIPFLDCEPNESRVFIFLDILFSEDTLINSWQFPDNLSQERTSFPKGWKQNNWSSQYYYNILILLFSHSVILFCTAWTITARLLCPWDFPDKNTGVGCHFLLQGISLTQRSNLGLLNGKQILYHWAPREAIGPYWEVLLNFLYQVSIW